MSEYRVRGLLDRPSEESLGMVGLVVEHEHELYVRGLVGSLSRSLDADEFKELVASGDAQVADGPVIHDDARPYAALWVGSAFAEKAERQGVSLPPLHKPFQAHGGYGTYWVALTEHVWRVIESWLIRAFRRAVSEHNAELAALMAWTLPEREETRAALWYTASEKERESSLSWWARLEQDHGHSRVTSKQLEKRYKRLIDKLSSLPIPRVYGFSAAAKGGDNEIAKYVSKHLHSPRLSFGQWLRIKVEREGKQVTRRLLQREGKDIMETRGALPFCLEVLSALPQGIPIPNAPFVIDGIRHIAVLDSLRYLVGEDHFRLVFIDRPRDIRRELLIREEGVPEDQVDDVMNDATESEIPSVATRASATFNRQSGVEQIGNTLLHQFPR